MDNKGPYHSVRIESDPDSVGVQHVFIDGEKLHGIGYVQLCFTPENVPTLYIGMLVGSLVVEESNAKVNQFEQFDEHYKVFIEGKRDTE